MRLTSFALLALGLAACGSRSVPGDAAGADLRHSDGPRAEQAVPACGDPKLMASFKSCQEATSQSACEGAGGKWTPIGLYPGPLCLCPTGQEGCNCTRSSDCLGSCTAVMLKMWECPMTTGTCTSTSPVVGCRCWFHDGKPEGMCAD
jgi:hypothetical protein